MSDTPRAHADDGLAGGRTASTRVRLGLVALTVLLLQAPAAAADDGPAHALCHAVRVDTSVVVDGVAVVQGPAIDTELVCYVYVNGQRVGAVRGTGAGPAAVAAGVLRDVPPGEVTTCPDAHGVWLDGWPPVERCP